MCVCIPCGNFVLHDPGIFVILEFGDSNNPQQSQDFTRLLHNLQIPGLCREEAETL